jgi:hypothetical protein
MYHHATVRVGSRWKPVDKQSTRMRSLIESDTRDAMSTRRAILSSKDYSTMEEDNQCRLERERGTEKQSKIAEWSAGGTSFSGIGPRILEYARTSVTMSLCGYWNMARS